MPCNGIQGCVDKFEDRLDQLSKITTKYNKHQSIVSGEFNENIMELNKSSENFFSVLLLNFLLKKTNLVRDLLKRPISTPMVLKLVQLNTFFYDHRMNNQLQLATRLEAIATNV